MAFFSRVLHFSQSEASASVGNIGIIAASAGRQGPPSRQINSIADETYGTIARTSDHTAGMGTSGRGPEVTVVFVRPATVERIVPRDTSVANGKAIWID